MEASEFEQHEGESAADEQGTQVPPTSEPSSADTEPAPAGSPSESTEEQASSASSPEEQTDESSAASSEPPPETSPSESDSSSEQPSGLLAGTSSEIEPGVGGTGDHPAPAAMIDPATGEPHVAGEAPAGTAEGSGSPVGDESDLQSGEVTDPEAREKLNAETEPEPVETDRPDIGTE